MRAFTAKANFTIQKKNMEKKRTSEIVTQYYKTTRS